MAYFFGLLFGNIGLFPKVSDGFREILKDKIRLPGPEVDELFNQGLITQSDVVVNQISSVQNILISVVILLAIPLLLFSLDFKKSLKLAKEGLLSFALAMVSLLASIFIGYFIYKDLIDESWKVSGLLIGLYTGGSPNLAAIGAALDVNANTFILTNTYDMVIGAVCLLFLMTLAQRLFNTFLPNFKTRHSSIISDIEIGHNEDIESFVGMLSGPGINQLLKGFGLSLIIVSIGGGLSLLVPEHAQMVTIILSITTLALVASTWKAVNKIKNTFQLGMYFIIAFSLIVASMGDLSKMFQIEYLHLFSFVALVGLHPILHGIIKAILCIG